MGMPGRVLGAVYFGPRDVSTSTTSILTTPAQSHFGYEISSSDHRKVDVREICNVPAVRALMNTFPLFVLTGIGRLKAHRWSLVEPQRRGLSMYPNQALM